MIVADSSFIIEALLNNKTRFEEDEIVSPDLALYEVANSVWKHQHLLKDVEEGSRYTFQLFDLVESGVITLIHPDLQLMKKAYDISGKEKLPVYDSIFLALALEIGAELRSLDEKMMSVFNRIS